MSARLRLQLPLWALSWPLAAGALAPPLRIAFDAGSLPTMYADAHGAPAGIYPALVRQAFELMGEPAEWVAEPFRRLLAALFAGSAAAGAAVRNDERLAVADYSADYFVEQLRLFHADAMAPPAPGIAGLRGLRVGVLRGWSYGEAFDAARARQLFQAEEVETDAKNFAKLQRGRLDAVVATELAGRMLLSGEQGPVGIVALPQPLISIGIALAVPKRLAARPLLQRFDAAIATLRREGRVDAIVAAELERARRLRPAADGH